MSMVLRKPQDEGFKEPDVTEALAREERDEAKLIFPTRRNLERLAQHGSFGEIAADAAAQGGSN